MTIIKERVLELIMIMFSIGLTLIVFWYGYQWLNNSDEKTAIKIQSANDVKANGMPVFAQFVFTQTLKLSEPIESTKIVVPIYFPVQSEWLQIDLRQKQDSRLIQRWRYRPHLEDATADVELPINPPQKISGNLELIFSAQHIDHDHQNQAPRVFIETADDNYPDGNYRIADNEKKGDIGLSLFALNPRIDQIIVKWQANTLNAVYDIARATVVLLLLCLVTYNGLSLIFSAVSSENSGSRK